jgi:hypothetical protein
VRQGLNEFRRLPGYVRLLWFFAAFEAISVALKLLG